MSALVAPGEFLGPDGIDPRQEMTDNYEHHVVEHTNDPNASFDRDTNSMPLEVYMHYAAIERAREDADPRPIPDAPWTVLIKTLTGRKSKIVHPHEPQPHQIQYTPSQEEKREPGEVTVGAPDNLDLTGEKETAYRVLRVASWQIVFYLITTDILGFSSSPAAFLQLGFGPGVLVYTFFYVLAFLSGQILWRMYLSMDSEQYPVTCYADLGERTFGRFVRHVFNVFQSLQLLFNVAILIIANGQTLASMIEWKFCFIALNIFWMLAGMVVGQIRTLRSFAWFTNMNIWLNIIVMVLTMVGISKYLPVPSQSNHTDLSQPIQTSGWIPATTSGWYAQVVGVQYAVFAYGGAMVFTEFMAEMRRPRDFWKAAFLAQLFCYLTYMLFGLYCYAKQGQYTSILPNLDFQNTTLSLVTNVIGLVSTGVATVLYANIGIKVFYHNVLRAYLKFPDFNSKKGMFVWPWLVIAYWAFAWVIGSAIPSISSLVTLIGAACILQFTYTFPPILLLGFWMQKDAIKGDRPWEPGMEPWSNRIDTWRDSSRWKRGFRKYWYVKACLFLLFLCAVVLAIIGIYAGIKQAIESYASGATTAFSCVAPGQPVGNSTSS
ncbi:uncharacterized protein EHS24_002463 [Apiotrichum porosum]|uniref:Amino acid transporter transmembrane domain-containing protein n=1 Tax=Apiotrichum porosum TaxID=105984 RepID=A0A427XGQ4_9TREE|nr:uncharacterized protein EHS24_002463 [Apiotrichum porosum]RSH78012.1 hypothetical protein EHS24_002463 [Apiotrichum porosum]